MKRMLTPQPSRRALLTGIAPWIAQAADRPVRVAVFGAGHAHALTKIATLSALPQFDLVGICEPDAEVRRRAGTLGGVRWLAEQEMLGDPTIELIAVESHVRTNVEYARRAIQAGKFVHLDKAPGTNLQQFRELLEEARRRKLTIQLGYQWRYHPGMAAAIEAARKGWLGDVYSLRARIDKPLSPADRKALSEFRGGMMFELGCHLIDRAIDLFGKPDRSTGYLWRHARQSDNLADNTLAVLEYPNATAEISIAAMDPFGGDRRTFQILGTNGSTTVRPFFPHQVEIWLRQAAGPYAAGRHEIRFPHNGIFDFQPDFMEMHRVVRDHAQLAWSPEHDLATHETLLRVCHELA